MAVSGHPYKKIREAAPLFRDLRARWRLRELEIQRKFVREERLSYILPLEGKRVSKAPELHGRVFP